MSKCNYVFLWGCGRDYIDYMCIDLNKYRNIKCRNESLKYTWNEKKKRYNKLFGKRIIGEKIYEKWLRRELNLDGRKRNYLIFAEDYLHNVDWDAIRDLRKKFNAVLILFICDPIGARIDYKADIVEEYKSKFDFIITTDRHDSQKYNLLFFPLIYSRVELVEKGDAYFDISFIGREKERKEILQKVEASFKNHGITSFMKYKERKITADKWISYAEVLKIVNNSNCILEIVQKNQTGLTLRTLEALCYNKKLLTNNAEIRKYPFYDPKFIQIFNDVSEINFEFIKSRINVTYNYYNEYSPLYLLKFIRSVSNQKNGRCFY